MRACLIFASSRARFPPLLTDQILITCFRAMSAPTRRQGYPLRTLSRWGDSLAYHTPSPPSVSAGHQQDFLNGHEGYVQLNTRPSEHIDTLMYPRTSHSKSSYVICCACGHCTVIHPNDLQREAEVPWRSSVFQGIRVLVVPSTANPEPGAADGYNWTRCPSQPMQSQALQTDTTGHDHIVKNINRAEAGGFNVNSDLAPSPYTPKPRPESPPTTPRGAPTSRLPPTRPK